MSTTAHGTPPQPTPGPLPWAALWTCPICCDLLFKPTVNICGHVFCHWCLHKAMSPYSESRCPICRSAYGHFPAVCGKLDRLLLCHFPEVYAQRQQETEAEERELGLTPSTLEGPPPATPPSSYSTEELLCESPACQRLLYRPVVLNCGHVVCSSCLPLPWGGAGGGGGAAACPACAHPVLAAPAPCKSLDELLLGLFTAEQAQRAEEVEAAAAALLPAPMAADVAAGGQAQQVPAMQPPSDQGGAGGSGAVPGGSFSSSWGATEEEVDEPTTPRAVQQEGGGAAPSAATVSPSLLSAIHRRGEEGGQASGIAHRIEENLHALSGKNYVHHGVGCDVCGAYPIKGSRYQCRDCPDSVGFDLCGSCFDRGPTPGVGRFNQRHTANHRVELVRPRITAMHLLQAANPDIPIEQLMFLLELATGGGGEDVDEGGPQAEHASAGADEGDEGDRPVSMPRWRGPRPAPDPTAEDPSPSAIAPAGDEGVEGDLSLVFVPLNALLGGEEEENGNQVEEETQGQAPDELQAAAGAVTAQGSGPSQREQQG